jgi:hypothetical protein
VTEGAKEVAMRTIGKTLAGAMLAVLAGIVVVVGGLYVAGLASASGTTPGILASESAAGNQPPELTVGIQPNETTDMQLLVEATGDDAGAKVQGPGLHRGAVHADVTALFVGGSTRTFAVDHGQITDVADGSLTLARRGGESVTVPTSQDTCIRKDGAQADLGDLTAGAPVGVVQEDGTAVIIRSGRPQPGTERQPCGVFLGTVHADVTVTYMDGSTREFDYDRGQITRITDPEFTLIRRDRTTVTLTYDDSTFVREEGKPGSVGDLAARDRAMFISEGGLAKLIRCIRSAAG